MTTKFTTIQSKFKQVELRGTVKPPAKRRDEMQTGVIVRRTANTFIPNEYLMKVLKENPNGWGACTLTKEGEKSFLQINSSDKGEGLEFFQETMKTFEDQDITFYFACAPDALSASDLSPYVLLCDKEGDEEIPQLVAFFDGNFPSLAQAESSHPPEYFLAKQLEKKIEGIYDALDDDLDALMENLKREKFKKELLLNCVSRGVITFVAANGVSLTYQQNDLSAEFPWGWTSNHYGYKEGKAAKVEAVADKPKVAFPSRSTVREKAAPSATIAAAVIPPKSDTAIPIVSNYSVKKEKPPEMLSRKNTKNWYKQKIGFLPKGWEDKVAIDVYISPQNKVMTFSEVKALGLKAPAVLALAKNPPADKDLEADNLPDTVQPIVDKTVVTGAAILPIMQAPTREHIKKMMTDPSVQKIIAENADILTDPKKYQAIEAKFADFARQVGHKSMDEFAQWSYEMMYELGKTNPDGLAVMCFTFRNMWLGKHVTEAVKEVEPEKAPMFPKRRTA